MKRRGIFITLLVVVVLVVGGGLLYLQPWDQAEERVSQESASQVLAEARASSITTGAAATAGESSTTTAAPATANGASLDGTWQLAPGVTSEVGFRINEELGGVGAKTVVGRTPTVTGSMTIAGSTVSGVRVEGDLTDISTDSDRRDNAIKTRGLETYTYPRAVFTQTGPMELPSVPAEGTPVSATISGELELHGVTKPVDVPLEAKLDGGIILVTGSQRIVLTDFGIEKPTGGQVLSIEDVGDLELQLFFARA
jgi:polyisoprenoid-binding protein YceI